MVKITQVMPTSRASKAGVRAGDVLLAINGNDINDVLDYRFYLAEKRVELSLSRDGAPYSVTVRKGEYDDIGLEFETPLMDKKHTCKNKCIFCFIDQNPEGLRDSLYFKDDDSRLSFIHGNYITLTNMSDADIDRIVKMRFSPINVSVHTTNPDLRVEMMKNKRSGEVLKYLRTLAEAGISMCAQIVLCKGVNDGEELRRTLTDLISYYPALTSVAVVPAGLTKFRDKLFPLTDFDKDEAGQIIDMIDTFGDLSLKNNGVRLIYAADEFYLKAGREIPPSDYYEDYPQIENGVGMLRSLIDEFNFALEDLYDDGTQKKRIISVATGVASYDTVKALASELEQLCPDLTINIYKIINKFFGESITVSGLLTGKDLYDQLRDRPLGEELLIPANALKCDENVFLCDTTLEELSLKLGVPVTPVASDGYELLCAMLGCSGEER